MDGLSKERIAELAWLAGLVDGEGHIGASRKKSRKKRKDGTETLWMTFEPVITIIMGHEEACRRAFEITGEGTVVLCGLSITGKEMWRWRARNQSAARALRLLSPYLIVKKRQAEIVLQVAEINGQYQSTRRWRARSPELTSHMEKLRGELDGLQSYTGHSRLTLN